MSMIKNRILAIDPGYERIGIAILEKDSSQKENLIFSECFKTSSKLELHERLRNIGERVVQVIDEYKPQALSTEKLYFTSNQKTVMGVSEARGVILFTAKSNGLEIFEYTPPQIKVAVTGYGKATKEMVMSMVPKLIKIEKNIKSDDELDAIAIGLTCFACEKL
ncbi:MAG: crossover junction endodeoxyribonuclease RuvC [Candidatus Moranbacteria bacterium]|nr:crossover junction endodeoxyribonuclease RuvC [Candidatus Moranbacteria bacterium]